MSNEWEIFKTWTKEHKGSISIGYGYETCYLDGRHITRQPDGRVYLTILPHGNKRWLDNDIFSWMKALWPTNSNVI